MGLASFCTHLQGVSTSDEGRDGGAVLGTDSSRTAAGRHGVVAEAMGLG